MFFSLSLVIQFGLLWMLITLLAHEGPQSSLTMSMKILAVFALAKIALRLLILFQFPEIHWAAPIILEIALLYLLVWRIVDNSPKVIASICLCFLIATLLIVVCFRLFASLIVKSFQVTAS